MSGPNRRLACVLGHMQRPQHEVRHNNVDAYIVKPTPSAWKVLGKKTDITIDEIPTLHAEMRACYDAGVSKPLATRLEQMKQLRRMFVENQEAIVAALRSDLGRPLPEAYIYDYFTPLTEIEHMIKALPKLAAARKVGGSLLTFPSSQYLLPEPKGVALVIGTWNYPIMLSLVPVLGAIAAGNCVVLKPCVVSPASANLLAQLIRKYMDPRIVNVVGQQYDRDRTVTAKLLEYQWDHIFFTGSPDVGKVIAQGAAKFLTPVTLELGGKNPVFVDHTADLDIAAKRVVWGRMMNAGQQCIGPDYVLCDQRVFAQFSKLCGEYTKKMYCQGDPKSNGDVGKIVGVKQAQRLIGLLKSHGGKVVVGGGYDEKLKYIEPTVLEVPIDSPAMAEETFGPILLLVSVKSMDDAIAYVNTRPKPLSLYLFSTDKKTQDRIIANTSAGGVTVNATLFHAGHSGLPFGGVGDSGLGAYHGDATFHVFSHDKPVLVKSNWWSVFGLLSDPVFLYPPWTDRKVGVIKFLFSLL